mmetsp:Transcript_46295/g.138401  ORF Transcript_46295/g.138401 Transcript_46295/m.138401 type:complete len:241 (-) Transcript_46295:1778-2500(-)
MLECIVDRLRQLLQGLLDLLLEGGVGRVRLQVHRSPVPRDGHVALLAIALGLRTHADDPQDFVLRRLLQRLHDLVRVHLPQGLAALDCDVVSHGHRGGDNEPPPEVFAELLQGEVTGCFTTRAFKGSLQFVLREERILLFAQGRELCDKASKFGLVEPSVLASHRPEHVLLAQGLQGHVPPQRVDDLLEPHGGQKIVLLVRDERGRKLSQCLHSLLKALYLRDGLREQPGGHEAVLLVAQ